MYACVTPLESRNSRSGVVPTPSGYFIVITRLHIRKTTARIYLCPSSGHSILNAMTTESPATALRNRREKLGMSLNDLVRKSGVSRRTICRCEEGEFSSNSRKVESLVTFLFPDEDEQRDVMDAILERVSSSREDISERRRRKAECTRASKNFYVKQRFEGQIGFYDDESYRKIYLAQQEGSTVDDSELRFKHHDAHSYLEVYERRRGSDLLVMIVDADKGVLFFGDEYEGERVRLVVVSALNTRGTSKTIPGVVKDYLLFCRNRQLHKYALLDLCRRALEVDISGSSDFPHVNPRRTNKDDLILARRSSLNSDLKLLLEAVKLLNGNKKDKVRAAVFRINLVGVGIRSNIDSADDAKRLRAKLLKKLNQFPV